MPRYSRLFSPIQVGSMTLKNRIVMPAMHHLYTENGHPTDRFNEYYWKRAEGGAGLVIVGACRFDDYGAKLSTMSLRSDEDVEPWKRFTEGMHKRDCKVAVQLYHAGRYMPKKDVPCGDEALAPSAVYCSYTRETAREMNIREIKQVIYDWAHAAVRAKEAGFDAVEILGSAGYLISQFLSPVTNQRTDMYGGSAENRMRFPLEVIENVRRAVGPEYPLILRLGGNDLVHGSCGVDDAAYFAREAERTGIDMINLTGGWHESVIPQLTQDLPFGGLSYLAERVKQAVSIPVSMANRMGDPHTAEEALALGRADLITMGRPLVADPELPNKARRGKPEEIRRCVACNQGCLANTFFDRPVRCLVNGSAGREYLLDPKSESKLPRNILVIGGGPAGCEFAYNAARRGHRVKLWERGERLGGMLLSTMKLPFRSEFGGLVKYYETMLPRVGVEITLGRIATRDAILEENPDVVILATGRKKRMTELPRTADSVPVYESEQVINGEVIPGRNVVVIGGSFIGCETARKLALDASMDADQLYYFLVHGVEPVDRTLEMLGSTSRRVSLVDRGKIGVGYESGVAWTVMKDLKRLGVQRFANSEVLNITSRGVAVMRRNKDGTEERITIPCDSVVVAAGTEPETGLYDTIYDKVETHIIGNAAKLGRAIEAVEAGVTAAYEI